VRQALDPVPNNDWDSPPIPSVAESDDSLFDGYDVVAEETEVGESEADHSELADAAEIKKVSFF